MVGDYKRGSRQKCIIVVSLCIKYICFFAFLTISDIQNIIDLGYHNQLCQTHSANYKDRWD